MKREVEPDAVMTITDGRPDPIVWIIEAMGDEGNDRPHTVPDGNSESVDNTGSR
jgi:hypothetical protein